MHYSPQNEECPMALNPFKACVAPRPIGWISTVSRDGIDNLAPFSQFQNLSYDPPMVMIAINQGAFFFAPFKHREVDYPKQCKLILVA